MKWEALKTSSNRGQRERDRELSQFLATRDPFFGLKLQGEPSSRIHPQKKLQNIMPSISGTLSSPSWIPSSKFSRRGSIDKNITHFHDNFGVTFPSKTKISTLQVKVDDAQYPLNLNNFGKISDQEDAKSRYVCDEFVLRQKFVVRMYELDIHGKASLEALLNYTQETSVNLCQRIGLTKGIGVSEEMSSKHLSWVTGRNQVVVDSYPSWEDIVQVETWCSASGKHTCTASSRLTDSQTGESIMRVDSDFMVINGKTRRLSRIPEEIRARVEPTVRDINPLPIDKKYENFGKLQKFDQEKADHVQKGIKPMWFDLDPNQHVNNVKYISWVLEGTPESVREKYELEAIILEYRKECGRENVLQSLSVASNETPQEFHHLVLFENGVEAVRAKSLWRSKPIK